MYFHICQLSCLIIILAMTQCNWAWEFVHSKFIFNLFGIYLHKPVLKYLTSFNPIWLQKFFGEFPLIPKKKKKKSHHREQVSRDSCAGLSWGSVCVRTWRKSQIRSWEYWPNITSQWDVHLARTQEPASKSGNWKRHRW